MYNNPYYPYNNTYYPQQQRLNQLEQQYPQFANNNYMNQQSQMMNNHNIPTQTISLQGKAVDSIDVVKATDVPLDGSIIYFPQTDGSAIYTKQLQKDGTSKISIYTIQTERTDAVEQQNKENANIEKIYADIADIKKNIDNNISTLINRFDEFKEEISTKIKDQKKTTTTTRGGRK